MMGTAPHVSKQNSSAWRIQFVAIGKNSEKNHNITFIIMSSNSVGYSFESHPEYRLGWDILLYLKMGHGRFVLKVSLH
jgi:hypothetical protein